MVGQDIQECPDQVEVFSCNIGNKEYWTYSLTDELGSCVNTFLARLDESWDLAGSRTLHNLGDLCQSLLQDVRWADVNLGDDNHDRYIESQGDTQMLLAHADKAVVRCDHEEAVIGATRE